MVVPSAATEIHAAQGDPEAAHGLLDSLYADVLAAIAVGPPEPRMLAAAALYAESREFPRWYA